MFDVGVRWEKGGLGEGVEVDCSWNIAHPHLLSTLVYVGCYEGVQIAIKLTCKVVTLLQRAATNAYML